MNREDIIRMAREAGFNEIQTNAMVFGAILERFAALVAAAERERFYGEDKPDSCVKGCPVGQVCDYCQIIKPVQEQIAKAVSAEREACAKVCLETEPFYGVMFAAAIRAREQA